MPRDFRENEKARSSVRWSLSSFCTFLSFPSFIRSSLFLDETRTTLSSLSLFCLLSNITREHEREKEVIMMDSAVVLEKRIRRGRGTRTVRVTRQRRGGVMLTVMMTLPSFLVFALVFVRSRVIRPMDREASVRKYQARLTSHHRRQRVHVRLVRRVPSNRVLPTEKAIEKRYGCSACDLAKGGETEKCRGT